MKLRHSVIALCILTLQLVAGTAIAQTVTIGTGTSSSYFYGPYYRSSASSSFNYSRYAHLYTATELGIPAGSIITQVEWYKVSGTLTGNNIFNVLMLNTTANSLTSGSTWGSLTSGATTVYASSTKSFTVTGNWESITLATPFVYTGGNLLIFTDHRKLGTASGSNNFRYTSASGKGLGYASSAAPSSSSTLTTTYGNNRPNIRITYTAGCVAPTVASHPSSTSVCNGGSTTFNVSTTTSNPIYQWQISTNGGSSWANIINGGEYAGVTTTSLQISGVTTGMNNYKYRCEVGVTCSTATVNSNPATLTIQTAPVIAGNPSGVTICAGNNTSFTASATGSGIAYQWQVNQGSGFTNISNGTVYSGATASTLNITNASFSMSGYQYRCYFTGTCTPFPFTSAATLTVNPATAITNNPDDITVCPSGNVNFSISANGTALTYQWQQSTNGGASWVNLTNTSPFSNVNTPTMNIAGVTIGMNGYRYRCVATGTCSAPQASAGAKLEISSSIPIASSGQPQNTAICVNTNASFDVVAASAGITYQWQVNQGAGYSNIANGGNYTGATTATLNLSNTPLSFNGNVYRCMVGNACVAPFSTNGAVLTVNSYPGVATQPGSVTACESTNAVFSVSGAGLGISYQWQQNAGSGFVNLPATIFGYTGQLSSSLTIINVTAGMNGYLFRCIINGQCAPPAVSNPATLTVQGKPTITTQPVDKHICVGSNTDFSLNATGAGINYQWQSNTGSGYSNITNGGVYGGATTNTLTLTAPPANMFGTDYRCIISGTCTPAATSAVAKLHVNTPPAILSQPTDRTVCEGGGTSFTLQAFAQSSTVPVMYQWQVNNGTGFVNMVNGTPYSGVTTTTLAISSVTSAMDKYRYRCIITSACSPQAQSNVVILTVNTKPVVTKNPDNITSCPATTASFTVTGSGTSLNYRWQENKGTGFANLNDNAVYSGSSAATLNVIVSPSMNNWQYRCVLSGTCTPTIVSAAARLTALNPVIINAHTITDTVCEGATFKIGLTASGTSLKYQWQRKIGTGNYVDILNLPPYSGVNTDSLRFTNAPDTIGGYLYRCRVYETILCAQSFYTADIPVMMNYAPDISPVTLTTGPGKIAVFTVPAAGTTYVWQENQKDGAGYKNLSNIPPYSINQNTLSVTTSQLMNGNTYRCIVDGICKSPVISSEGSLIVDPLNLQITTRHELKVYPNPVNETLFVDGIDKETRIQLFDVFGRNVYNAVSPNSVGVGGGISIPTRQLPLGNYILQLFYPDGTRDNVKLVKQ